MSPFWLIILLFALSTMAYRVGRKRATAMADDQNKWHSRPVYYGLYSAIWCLIPAFLIFSFWLFLEPTMITRLVVNDLPPDIQHLHEARLNRVINDIRNLAAGNDAAGQESRIDLVLKKAMDRYRRLKRISRVSLSVICLITAMAGMVLAWRKILPRMRARNQVETFINWILIICATLAIFITLGIVLSVLFEAIRFFNMVPFFNFLFGLKWSPQIAIRADQVGASGAFGMVPVFAGTILISVIAMLVAVPLGLMSAIYLSEYANRRFRDMAKPLLEILAGIPTVVYGFFAALTVAPFIRQIGEWAGLQVSSESALAAGLVMGVMIIPFVSSLSDDVINAVPQAMRDGSYALGATHSETIRRVILPAALPGIVGSIMLAVSRAIGETMIVVMAAGLSANLTANPLKAVTTVTVQIVTLLVGDQEFDSPKTLAAFALGLVLFVATLLLNIIALKVVNKYREQYE